VSTLRADRAVRLVARETELQRAVRAHPAGRALRAGADRLDGGRPVPAEAVRPGLAVASPPRLRLTPRGRVLVAVLVLALAVGVVAVAGALLGGGAGGRLHLVGESRVVVHSGDTLWSIASTVAGDDDIRPVIARIQQVNGLHGTTLVPGQVLRLP
jgi:nucleoid-associated protein YgaU